MNDKLLNKRIGWCTGMLCDLTDVIDQSVNDNEYDLTKESSDVLKDEIQKLEDLLKKMN